MADEDDGLNEKQRLFCHEYLKDLNAKQAYIRAGYSPDGAEQNASRLMSIDKVSHKLDQLMAERAKSIRIDSAFVIRELIRIAGTDLSQAYDDAGNLLPIKDMPEDCRRAIAGVEIEELFSGRGSDKEHIGHTRKVKFWDKPKALELLGKHLKMFTDKVEHSGQIGLAELLSDDDDETA